MIYKLRSVLEVVVFAPAVLVLSSICGMPGAFLLKNTLPEYHVFVTLSLLSL